MSTWPGEWPRERSRHGGFDQIPLPAGVAGRLWLCGKRFIAPDPEAALDLAGATAAVCLCEAAELTARYPGYVNWLSANIPTRALWFPIPDLHAPGLEQAIDLLAKLRVRLEEGQTLLMHCGAGIGRAGTIAAGLLITLGVPLGDATAQVAAHRPMAGPEVGAQTELLHALTTRFGPVSDRGRAGGP
jgi:protein-tyrosine phosphatase